MSTIDRTAFIGGSDASAILGVSPWKSAFQLYQEKIGAYVEEITLAKQRIFDRGHRWEPVVVEMLMDELRHRGHDVQVTGRNQRYSDHAFPFLQCEVDLELLLDGQPCSAEMKTVHPFAAKEWGEQDTDEIPIYYAAQAMHGLMIKPRRHCIVAALIGVDDLRVHQIERDEETISAIRAKEIEFWRRVQERDAPDPETYSDVRWLYAKDDGSVSEADEEVFLLYEELCEIKDAIKYADVTETLLETKIKLAMKHATALIYKGKKLCTWKAQPASRIDVTALKELLPEVAKQFTKTTESRVFRLAK